MSARGLDDQISHEEALADQFERELGKALPYFRAMDLRSVCAASDCKAHSAGFGNPCGRSRGTAFACLSRRVRAAKRAAGI